MAKQPFVFSSGGAIYWSGFAQTTLQPILQVIKDGNTYRPATSADFASATITGAVSGTFVNTVRQVGVTGSDGTPVDVFLVSGFRSLPVFLSSGSISSTTSNPVNQVGITGLTGTGLDIVNASGYRAIPVIIASGNITSTAANPVLQVGITGLTGTGLDIVNASGYRAIPVILASGSISASISNNVTQVGITGVTGLGTDVALVSGFRAIPVFIVSGQGAGGGSSSSPSIVGLSGSGVIVSVLATPNLTGLSVVSQGISNSGASGNMPFPLLGGAWVNPLTTGSSLAGNTLQALQLDSEGNLYVSLGTALTSSVDSVSVRQSGAFQIGITGATGNAVSVTLVSGFNSIPVFLSSGSISSTSTNPVTQVSITGSNGVAVVVDASGRLVSTVVPSGAFQVQGVSGSGVSGNMPNPVLGGGWVNPLTTGTSLAGNTLQSLQLDSEGNLYATLGTAISHLIDSISTRPSLPTQNIVYSIALTGVGGFGNYSGTVPNITGNVVVMSVQPHSQNTLPIYYSFSGGASTGNAWEIRGDRTFETNSNLNVFFAQTTGSQIVNIHAQTF